MKDLRNLPPEVVERIEPSWLAERHKGFDIDYRNRTLEMRANRQTIEVRRADNGDPILDGYATVYEFPYDVAGGPSVGGWTEIIAEGAASRSVAMQDEVFLFFDHEGLPMASTRNNSLVLESDRIGLRSTATIDQRSNSSMEIVHRVESHILDAMSFAFQATRQEWNSDYTERRILEVKLYDTSVVSYPANPATVVAVRSQPKPRMSLAYATALRAALQ